MFPGVALGGGVGGTWKAEIRGGEERVQAGVAPKRHTSAIQRLRDLAVVIGPHLGWSAVGTWCFQWRTSPAMPARRTMYGMVSPARRRLGLRSSMPTASRDDG